MTVYRTGQGLLGRSVVETRIASKLLLLCGIILLVTMPSSPLALTLGGIFSREIGFFLTMLGVILFVIYQ